MRQGERTDLASNEAKSVSQETLRQMGAKSISQSNAADMLNVGEHAGECGFDPARSRLKATFSNAQ